MLFSCKISLQFLCFNQLYLIEFFYYLNLQIKIFCIIFYLNSFLKNSIISRRSNGDTLTSNTSSHWFCELLDQSVKCSFAGRWHTWHSSSDPMTLVSACNSFVGLDGRPTEGQLSSSAWAKGDQQWCIWLLPVWDRLSSQKLLYVFNIFI